MEEWKRIDLHIHTRKGNNYNNGGEDADTGKYYSLENLYQRNKINNFELISFTNHNSIDVIELLKASYISKFSNTNLLPGVELDVFITSKKRYHIVVIFSETTDIIRVSSKLEKLINANRNNFLYLDNLFDLISGTECIIIPHACKNPHGLKETSKDDVNISDAENLMNIITSSSSINVLFEHTQPHFKESFKENIMQQAIEKWYSEEEIEELKNRIETEYTASDYRFSKQKIEKETRKLPLIWASPTFRGLQLACMFHKNRIRIEDNILNKTNYIKKIIIEGSKNFAYSEIELSSGLNSIIGESASGKTALLDIITTNLIGENAVAGKNYSGICSDLKVSFFNQSGLPLKQDYVNIHIAENLYDAIKSAHDKEDNTSILKLFKFTEIKQSTILKNYERRFNEVVDHLTRKNKAKKDIKQSFENIEERSKTLLKNIDNNVNKYVIEIPNLEEKTNLDYLKEVYKEISTYKTNLKELNDAYLKIKYKLDDLKIEHKLEDFHLNIKNEIERISKIIVARHHKINYRYTVVDKLSTIINTLNNSINQKNAYISSTKLKLYEDTTSIKSSLKDYYINKIKYKNSNLDFPCDEIKDEMKERNSHPYVEVEYCNIEELLKLDDDSGIINLKNNLRLVDKQRGAVIKNDKDIKTIIEIFVNNEKTITLRLSELLQTIIQKAKIKIGFPTDEKIDINELTPGLTAKLYIDYMFNVEIENGVNNIVVFDQPENDVDKEFIFNELIPKFDKAKFNLQIIITSHEPLLVINGDTNQIIRAEKSNKKIKYTSFKLDEYLNKNTITSIIARYIDGSITAVKNRYEIYIGGKK